MKKELREKIIAYNLRKAKGDQARIDIITIFGALNEGQKKQLVKNDEVAEIFSRYGIQT